MAKESGNFNGSTLDLTLPKDYPALYQAPSEFDYQGMNQLLAQDPSLLRKLLLNLQASGQINKIKNYGTDVLFGGGRVGSRLDNVGFGLQGGGYKAKGDWGSQKQFNVDPYFDVNYGDIGGYYSPDKFGATYQGDNSKMDIGYSPANKLLQFMYNKQF